MDLGRDSRKACGTDVDLNRCVDFFLVVVILLRMFCVSVLYPANPSSNFNLSYYLDSHIPLVRKLLTPHGMQRVEVGRGVGALVPGAPTSFHAIAGLYFATMDELEKGLAAAAPQLGADIPNYYSAGEPVIQINEVVAS